MTTSTYTSSGTFICPNNVYSTQLELYGGGFNGTAGLYKLNGGDGGGSGGYSIYLNIPLTPGHSYTVTVGGISGDSTFTGDDAILRKAGGAIGLGGGSGTTAGQSGISGGQSGGRGGTCPGPLGGTGGSGGLAGSPSANAQPGGNGTIYGSGGGGGGGRYNSGSSIPGGVGRGGAVILTYTPVVSVTKTAQCSWVTLKAMSPVRTSSWNTKASVFCQKTSSWNSRKHITYAQGVTWNANQKVALSARTLWFSDSDLSAVSKPGVCSWNSLARVTASAATVWRVSVVTVPVGIAWNSNTSVRVSKAVLWNTDIKAAKASRCSWNSMKLVSPARPVAWKTRALIRVPKTAAWNTKKSVKPGAAVAWNTRKLLLPRTAISWNTQQSRTTAKLVKWNTTKGRIVATADVVWRVRTRVTGVHRSLAWRDYLLVSAVSNRMSWNVKKTMTRRPALAWRAASLTPRVSLSISVRTTWNDLQTRSILVGNFGSGDYGTGTYGSPVSNVMWNVRESGGVEVTRSCSWNARKSVTKNSSARWNTMASSASTHRPVSWNTLQKVGVD